MKSGFLEERRRLHVGLPQLDAKLLEGSVQCALVARKVRRHCVVKQQQLLVHDLHLPKRKSSQVEG